MTHYTYTDCTPEEAAVACARMEDVYFSVRGGEWQPIYPQMAISFFHNTKIKWSIRRDAPQETVQEALDAMRLVYRHDAYWRAAWLRVFSALKREILEEVRK